jgi:hypothetical protein
MLTGRNPVVHSLNARIRKVPGTLPAVLVQYRSCPLVSAFGASEIRQLLEQRWTPPGLHLPQQPLEPKTVAAIIRITGANFPNES